LFEKVRNFSHVVEWKMKKKIHINMHKIRANKKHGTNEPVITVKTYKSNTYGHEVEILGNSKVVYSPDKPLSCGARVWIETDSEVMVDGQALGL
jgi:hypothetical protein